MTSTRSADGLEAIEPWLGEVMQSIEPGKRKTLADKLLRLLRRANARRIATNTQPDGSAMVPRKKREKGKRGKMFKRIGRASSLKTRVTAEGGELRFVNPLVERTAAEHHFGLEGFVGRSRKGRIIRTKYQARELLGFGSEADDFADEVLQHLSA